METKTDFDSEWSIRIFCDLSLWAFGWFGTFRKLGIGVLWVGPFRIHLTWPIDEKALGA